METWLFLDSGAGAPAQNMALDEALLREIARLRRPVLRTYRWDRPAATFGYFQKLAEVECWTNLRPLIRRPTGGGLVPHEADWTYSLIFPPSHGWHALRAEESYRRLHEWIRDAFIRVQIDAQLSPCCDKQVPGQCFAGPEKFDLTWRGQKIAGAAQRRSREGMLIQGSIQPLPPVVGRGPWTDALRDAAMTMFGIRWEEYSVDGAIEELARSLAAEKYSQEAFNRRR